MATFPKAHKEISARALPLPSWTDVVNLGAAAAESYTVPAGAEMIWITWDNVNIAGLYMRVGGAAAVVPGADLADGTGSCALSNPAGEKFLVGGGELLSFINPLGGPVTINVYRAWS